MALPTEMDSVGLAIMKQIKQERDVQAVDIAGKCNDENDGPDGTEAGQGGQARQGRKEQTDMVVSALTGSITKRMEQIVSQEMKKMLPGLVSRGPAPETPKRPCSQPWMPMWPYTFIY